MGWIKEDGHSTIEVGDKFFHELSEIGSLRADNVKVHHFLNKGHNISKPSQWWPGRHLPLYDNLVLPNFTENFQEDRQLQVLSMLLHKHKFVHQS